MRIVKAAAAIITIAAAAAAGYEFWSAEKASLPLPQPREAAAYNLFIATENGDARYAVEEASSDEELEAGLMNRDYLPENAGMIFDLTKVYNLPEAELSMWMKDTRISLDMLFIQPDGKIVWIQRDAEPMSEKLITPPVRAAYVLELNAGQADKRKIKVGDEVRHRFFGNLAEEDLKPASVAPGNAPEGLEADGLVVEYVDEEVSEVPDSGEGEETILGEAVDVEPLPVNTQN